MMKKRICTLLLALVLLGSLVIGAFPAMAAEGQITMRLHYHRPDGNYENWDLWLWDNSSTTPLKPPYYFTAGENDVVATVPINAGTMEVGFIVRYSTKEVLWAGKDWEDDQYIDLAGLVAGTVDVYVESGVEGYRIEYGPDAGWDTVIVSAAHKVNSTDGSHEVIAKMSGLIEGEVTPDTFSVFSRNETLKITAVRRVNNFYYLTLSEPLDKMGSYMVQFGEYTAVVKMQDVYSTEEFEELYTYKGKDLGYTYTPAKTSLRVWVPQAESVAVKLYSDGDPAKAPEPTSRVEMKKDVKGTWVCELPGDLEGTYYTYEATYLNGVVEVADPYGRSSGVNGHRSMIFDLDATDPEGWENDRNPHAGGNITDYIFYEIHIRDMTADASSGIKNKGKYLAFTETNTDNGNGIPTALAHMRDLGVTHVHLLPVYDYGSVDETLPEEERNYNWGYDPVALNVPDGSYATDATDGRVRVREFKQMVQSMHSNGLAVVMDVVYNHVYDSGKFSFNVLVPGYYVRTGSKACGVGDDVASERAMVSKYIVDSVNYWADEYHIDGFRFDLMGILDTDTMNEIVRTVHEKHPDVVFYGEGWEMNSKLSKTGYSLANQKNASKMPEIAHFNDFFRNLVKGGTYGGISAGWISGGQTSTNDLNNAFMGRTSWCKSPTQSINYVSSHDNNTLFDHITMVAKNATFEQRVAMNKLAAAFTATSQGVFFIQAGEEMLRSKPDGKGGFISDSYASPDSVNALKYNDLNDAAYMAVYNYYKGLIAFRKEHPALRLTSADAVNANVKPLSGLPEGIVAYNIRGGQEGENADYLFCAFNATATSTNVTLPEGEWEVYVDDQKAGIVPLRVVSGTVEVPACGSVILAQGIEHGSDLPWGLILILSAAALTAATLVTVIILKKKK